MARYNSVNTTGSIAGGNSITTPNSGLLTTLTGSGTVTIPNPVYYTGQTQAFYNSTLTSITLSTPSGVITGPGLGVGSGSLNLPAGSIITLVSDGTNYLTQAWLGGNISATTLSASAGVNLNPNTTGSIDNINIGATTQATGKFTSLTTTSTVTLSAGANINSTASTVLSVSNTSIGGGNSSGITAILLGDAASGVGVLQREKQTTNTAATVLYHEYGFNVQSKSAYFDENNIIFYNQAGTERVRINSSGYVGIGTNSPAVPLDINTTSTTTGLRMSFTSGQTLIMAAGSLGVGLWQVGTGSLNLGVNSNGSYTSPTGTQLTITNTGNVGIGYATDQTPNGLTNKLSVNGNAYVNGTLYAQVAPQGFALTWNGGSGWMRLGTLHTSQQGFPFNMEISSFNGWNASTGQNQLTRVYFKTSNTSSNVGGFYGDCQALIMMPSGTTSSPSSIIVKQTTDYNTFEFWAFMGSIGFGSYITYDTAPGTYFTPDGATNNGSTAPTGTIITVTPQLNVTSNSAIPSFYAYGVTGGTYASGNYWIFPSVGVNITGAYNSSNGVFTAPTAGTYQFSWSNIGNNTRDVYRYWLYINNSSIYGNGVHLRCDQQVAGYYGAGMAQTAIVSMNYGDTARIFFSSDASNLSYPASNATSNNYPMFMGRLLG